MGKIAAYARISTSSQDIELQRQAIDRWCTGFGLVPVYYVDTASGKSLERPQWQKLQSELMQRKYDTLVVWKLDRLSRSLRDGINTLADLCAAGVRVVSVTQQLDLAGTTGQLIAAVLLSVAQIERELIVERVRAGVETAKANGKRWGGSVAGRLLLTPEQQTAIAAQVAQGVPLAQIARSLGIAWRTVRKYAQRNSENC